MMSYPPQLVTLSQAEIDSLRIILQCCAPSQMELHLFESVPEILDAVHANNLLYLEACLRSDVRRLPECNAEPWLSLLERASETLVFLSIGGRLTDAECEYNNGTTP